MTTIDSGFEAPSVRSFPLAALLPLFVGTIFLSAFLLFGVQPMFTKMILPVLGGSPSVWSVAMVFFQALLLAGYAYAHALARHLPLRAAAPLHLALMGCALLFMPIGLAAGWGRPPAEGEAYWLLGLFLASVGLPFFALSANGPLLQSWFSRSGHPHARDPYFLYAASNFGSFAALLAYPLAVEPLLPLDGQSRWWMAGFVLLAVLIAASAVAAARFAPSRGEPVAAVPAAEAATGRAAWRQRFGWVALSLVPSGLLVAVTAHISTDVAAAPLLWVVPLALFLLTFVLAFRERPIVSGGVLALLQVAGTVLALLPLNHRLGLSTGLLLHLGLFFVNCLICHGALYRRRPAADRLTEFYLCLSLGGVLGGIFCGLVAPRVFSTVLEYPILLAAALLCRPGPFVPAAERLRSALCAFAALLIAVVGSVWAALTIVPENWFVFCLYAPPAAAMVLGRRRLEWVLLSAVAMVSIAAGAQGALSGAESFRSFFGVHKIGESPDKRFRILSHGTTVHGAMRILNDDGTPFEGRPEPIAYYAPDSPLGAAVAAARAVHGGALDTVAAIGLGSGSLACHARHGETWTFFEIDPEVARIARDPKLFRFLDACAPGTPIVLGDARLTLAEQPGPMSLIIVDAFSSDAIPSHLITREALALYLSKLDATGAVVVHISNRHLELRHILARAAAEHGLLAYVRDEKAEERDERGYRFRSAVVAIARDAAHLGALAGGTEWTRVAPDMTRRAWSDDYSNIVEAILDKKR